MAVVSGFRRTFTTSRTFALLALAFPSALAAQQAATFVPPRIASAFLPAVPPPNVIAGGEVLVEAIIDRSGAVTRPVLLRSTPPYSQLMLEAITRWRFAPARAANPQGEEAPVDAPVLIAAVYRPPTLFSGATAGEPPKDLAAASSDVPYPSALIAPAYPPNALHAETAVLIFEVMIDETGAIRSARPVASNPAFDSTALDALMQWKFRPSMFRGRPAPAAVYVMFGFNPVATLAPPRPLPPS